MGNLCVNAKNVEEKKVSESARESDKTPQQKKYPYNWPVGAEQVGYLTDATLYENDMSTVEARRWCDRAASCAGFTLRVAVDPHLIAERSIWENSRAPVSYTHLTLPTKA